MKLNLEFIRDNIVVNNRDALARIEDSLLVIDPLVEVLDSSTGVGGLDGFKVSRSVGKKAGLRGRKSDGFGHSDVSGVQEGIVSGGSGEGSLSVEPSD